MTQLAPPSVSGPAFAVFRGTLSPDRVRWLFSRRSVWDRCLEFALFLLLGTGIAALFLWLARGLGFPDVLEWCLASLFGGSMLVFGLLHQSSRWLGRRWVQWNSLLTGPYEIELTDRHFAVRTECFALRLPYLHLHGVDTGLDCVRLKLDFSASRALLLPIDDCQPSRTVSEVHAYAREQILSARLRGAEQAVLPDRDTHLPFALLDVQRSVPIDGPARLAEWNQVMETDAQKPRSARIKKRLEVFLHAGILLLVLFVGAALALGHRLPQDILIQTASFGVMLILLAVVAFVKWSKRAELQADPYAAGAEFKGFLSPAGVAVRSAHGDIGVTWSRCDAVEFTDSQVLVRFWRGDFLLLGRHMFRSDGDWRQAVEWARCAESQKTATQCGLEQMAAT